MAEVVGLDGKAIEAPIPENDTPRATLIRLLDNIDTGHIKPKRILIVVEFENGFFTRASRMMTSEAIAIAEIGRHLLMRAFLGT